MEIFNRINQWDLSIYNLEQHHPAANPFKGQYVRNFARIQSY